MNKSQADGMIPPHIYEIAARYGLETPLKRRQRKFIIVPKFVSIPIFFLVFVSICYNIYAAFAIDLFPHSLPDPDILPILFPQLENTIWLKLFHEQFWNALPQLGILAIGSRRGRTELRRISQTQLYLCTEGLLLIYKKQEEAIRWDEVNAFYTTNGIVTRLVKEDTSSFTFPTLLMQGRDQSTNHLILEAVIAHLLPAALARYESGDIVDFGDLKVTQNGIFRPVTLVSWENLEAVALKKERLSLRYRDAWRAHTPSGAPDPGKWHVWRKQRTQDGVQEPSWPNLPVFVALVNAILDRRAGQHMPQTPDAADPTYRDHAAIDKDEQ